MAVLPPISSPVPGLQFEMRARRVLSGLWGVSLESRLVRLADGLQYKFDLVSGDGETVGDAKYYKNTLSPGGPAAKWSAVAEYVWLLQHAKAERKFMVFGQERQVPARWLERFRPLTEGVDFFFLDDDERLTQL